MQLKFEVGNNKKYQLDDIWDSVVYIRKSIIGQLLGLYYQVLWKSYLEKENTWELTLAI